MILPWRPIDKWPENWDRRSKGVYSPFSASYEATLILLERELIELGAAFGIAEVAGPFLQVDIVPEDFRIDGRPRANAQPGYRGVILTVPTRAKGTLVYACDRFEGRYRQPSWQANVRAIALGLEALRKVERYGIAERGQQYAGFAQIGSGIPMPVAAMTAEQAARFLAECAGISNPILSPIIANPELTYRVAAKRCHPDAGGDAETFKRLTEARDLLIGAAS